jgi:hypothetical protein
VPETALLFFCASLADEAKDFLRIIKRTRRRGFSAAAGFHLNGRRAGKGGKRK